MVMSKVNIELRQHRLYLWVVLCVTSAVGYLLQIQLAVQIDCGDNVPETSNKRLVRTPLEIGQESSNHLSTLSN
jgi:hypothetical protein